MEAKDLMVGDWIHAIDSEGNKHPCRANNLQYDYTNKRDDFCVDFYGTNHESEWPDITYDVEPIPLTTEILENNGITYEIGLGGLFVINLTGLNCSIQFNIIQYVHELQHALRLIGRDDLADNFNV